MRAQCVQATCAQMDSNTACNMSTWACQYNAMFGTLCLPTTYSKPPVGSACETDSNPCTSDACGGTAGQTSGDGVCHHNAVADGTACGANGVCSAGVCQCSAGYKQCGATCILSTACCTDTDCSSLTRPLLHLHGVCVSSTCTTACDTSYKICGGACIASTSCCSSTDCVAPPNGCYKAQGACVASSCVYTYADGAACNADNTACTPNDSCKSGKCVADTGHAVVCVKRDCHTTPSCNTSTGNCVDSTVPNGTACGGNGCTVSAGSCTAGVCSASPKDCTALDTQCRVGTCDATAPVGTPCAAANKPNGVACDPNDKCLLGAVCSGGACTGTPMSCTPSGSCRAAACNPGTGACEETVAVVGSACDADTCMQNATCDGSGTCVGSAVPDGTPCEALGCTSSCAGGQCSCIGAADLAPPIDSGVSPVAAHGGCDSAGSGSRDGALFGMLLLLALLLRSARRRI